MTVTLHDVVSVKEACERAGCNPAKVRELIRNGRLGAERVGNQWFIASLDVEQLRSIETPVGRPFSQRLCWGILGLLEGRLPKVVLHRQEQSRIRSYQKQPVEICRDRLRGRAAAMALSVSTPTLARLRQDKRWIIGGRDAARHHLGGFESGGLLTLYARASLKEDFLDSSLGVPDELDPNLLLRLIDDAVWPFENEIDHYAWGSVAWLDCHEQRINAEKLSDLWPPAIDSVNS